MMTGYRKEDPQTIESLFSNIASHYDRANSLMSLNLHKRWNRTLSKTLLEGHKPEKYLDLCCGTGEIAFTTLGLVQDNCEAFLLDFSDKMLSCAREKASRLAENRHPIHYIHADAQEIPLPTESIDAVTLAYGIRNVKDPSRCIADVFRVMKKGGTFAILELTRPTNPMMKVGHKLYTKLFLPVIGKFATSDKQAYEYLCRSIQDFIPPQEIESILKTVGFKDTSLKPLAGGIATIICGKK